MGFFDGVRGPLITVTAGFGGSLDPGPTYLHLGVGPGLGTGLLSGPGAGTNEVDITADVRSISLTALGAASDIDTADPVTATIVLSNRHGDYDPTNPASPYTGQLEDGTPIRVRASWEDVGYSLFYGELAGIFLDLDATPNATATFVCHDGLEKLARAYLPETTPTRDGDTTGERVNFLADQAGQPSGLRSIETGYTTLGRTILGESSRELMRLAEQTEFGRLFVDGAGRLVFYDRHHAATATRSTTVQATFADTGAGAVRIPALQLARSREGSFNRVAITRDPAPSEPLVVEEGGGGEAEDTPVEQVADDFAAQATKGVLGFPAEVGQLLRNDAEALAMAQYLVERYTQIQNRISQIEVNALRGQWGTLLGLGPLDRVEVSRDYGPNTITTELLVQSIAHEINVEPLSWSMTLTTSIPPAASSLWLVGSSQVGIDQLGW